MKRLITILAIILMVLFVGQPAYAADVEVVQKFYAGAGDGQANTYNQTTSWPTARGYSTSSGVGDTSTVGSPGYLRHNVSGSSWGVQRYFFPVDTSAIPNDASITLADLYLYVAQIYGDWGSDLDLVFIIGTTQASFASLTTADYDQCGSLDNPDEFASRRQPSEWTAGQYNIVSLNSTGLANISVTDYTGLGLRHSYDVDNVELPTGESSDAISVYMSEEVGTDKDPYLLITYTCDENDAPPVGGDVVSVTSIGGGGGDPECSIIGDVIKIASLGDIDASGYPETLILGLDASSAPVVCISDVNSGGFIKEISFFAVGWTPESVYTTDDMSSPLDGIEDISVMAIEDATGNAKAQIKDAISGALLKEIDLP